MNRFLTTEPFCQPQAFQPSVLKGKVNEWLKYGFSIYENPCRKEFLERRLKQPPDEWNLEEKLPGDPVSVFGQTHTLHIYFPFGNVNVECSRFYYVPTFLRTYAVAYLCCGAAHTAPLELCTCGGMTVWINGERVCDFTPFTRNLKQTTQVSAQFRCGLNRIIVCLDDLAERDTDYYFRIAYHGNDCPELWLPIPEHSDETKIRAVEQALASAYFDRDVYMDEPVRLCFDSCPSEPTTVTFCYSLAGARSRADAQQPRTKETVRLLTSDSRCVEVLGAGEVCPGFYFFEVKAETQGIELSKRIGTQVAERAMPSCDLPDMEQRAEALLEHIWQTSFPDVYRCAADYLLGREDAVTEQTIFRELEGVVMKKDCCDFRFVMILYLYSRFADRMTPALKAGIQEAAVGFRYWIDEPGDDVMWFFSENHALIFHICQYAAGTLFPEERFSASGTTGKQQRERGRQLLCEWFESFFSEFITEWNSTAYIPVDVLGLGVLYAFTEAADPLHACAKRALDDIFRNLSILAFRGTVMSSSGRTYEEHLKGAYATGTAGLLYWAFNDGCVNGKTMAYVALLLSDYRPPQECSQNLAVPPGQALVFRNTQGYERHANLYLCKSHAAMLSTAVGFKSYQAGYQEHIVEACIDPEAQLFITHPGECQPYGSGRPSYWAGNGSLPCAAQYFQTAILIYDIAPEFLMDYTHAYFPTMHFDETFCGRHCIAGRKGDAYIGAVCQNGLGPVEKGPTKAREFRSYGRQNVWLVQVSSAAQYPSLEDFVHNLQSIQIEQHSARTACVKLSDGTALSVEANGELRVNGAAVYDYPLTCEGIIERHKGVF